MSTSEYFLKFSKWANRMNAEGSDAYFRPYGEDEQPLVILDDLPIDKAMMVLGNTPLAWFARARTIPKCGWL